LDTAYAEDYTRTIETEVPIISIRPNPSDDKLTVQVTRVDFKKNLRFTIHDLSGKAITNGNMDTPLKSIYLLKLVAKSSAY